MSERKDLEKVIGQLCRNSTTVIVSIPQQNPPRDRLNSSNGFSAPTDITNPISINSGHATINIFNIDKHCFSLSDKQIASRMNNNNNNSNFSNNNNNNNINNNFDLTSSVSHISPIRININNITNNTFENVNLQTSKTVQTRNNPCEQERVTGCIPSDASTRIEFELDEQIKCLEYFKKLQNLHVSNENLKQIEQLYELLIKQQSNVSNTLNMSNKCTKSQTRQDDLGDHKKHKYQQGQSHQTSSNYHQNLQNCLTKLQNYQDNNKNNNQNNLHCLQNKNKNYFVNEQCLNNTDTNNCDYNVGHISGFDQRRLIKTKFSDIDISYSNINNNINNNDCQQQFGNNQCNISQSNSLNSLNSLNNVNQRTRNMLNMDTQLSSMTSTMEINNNSQLPRVCNQNQNYIANYFSQYKHPQKIYPGGQTMRSMQSMQSMHVIHCSNQPMCMFNNDNNTNNISLNIGNGNINGKINGKINGHGNGNNINHVECDGSVINPICSQLVSSKPGAKEQIKTKSITEKVYKKQNDIDGRVYSHNHNTSVFQCNECFKIFKLERNYIKHCGIHKGIGFTCQYCNKIFARRANLVEHIRIHTGDKPFRCLYCRQRFTQRHSQLDHQKRIHGKG